MSQPQRQKNVNVAPVVGKHYPTGRIASFNARHPSVIFFVSILPFLALTIVLGVKSPATDATQEDFLLTRFMPVDNANKVGSMVTEWRSIMSSMNTSGQITSILNTKLQRNIPVYRIEVRVVVEENAIDSSDASLPYAQRLGNLLSNPNMDVVQSIERKISSLSEFASVCFTNNLKNALFNGGAAPTCVPLSSLSGYFYPGDLLRYTGDQGQIPIYEDNGLGITYQAEYDRVVKRMMTNPDVKWYMDPGFTRSNPVAKALRLQVVFGAPAFFDGKQSSRGQFILRARKVGVEMIKIIDEANAAHPHMKISAGGDIMSGAILSDALSDEWYFVLAALFIAFIITLIRTKTFTYTLGVMVGLTLLYLSSLGTYSSGRELTIPFLTTTSVFLMTGLSLHVALSLFDCFKVSGNMFTTGRRNNLSLAQRISYTYRHACSSASLMIAITIVMFAGCMVTPFEGVRKFATLLIIQLCFLLFLTWTYFMSLVVVYHWHFSDADRLTQRQRDVLERQADGITSEARRHPLLRAYLENQEANAPSDESIYSVDMKGFAENQKSRRRNVANTRSVVKVLAQLGGEVKAPFFDNIQLARLPKGKKEANTFRPRIESFDENAFMDASELKNNKSGNNKGNYTSSRLVPLTEIIHIPPKSIFEYQGDVVATVREAEKRHEESTGERIFSSSSESDNDASPLSPLSRSKPFLKRSAWFVNFGENRRSQNPSPMTSVTEREEEARKRKEQQLESDAKSQLHFSRFVAHWHEVARRIGFKQGPSEETRVLGPLVAFMAQSLTKSTDFAKIVAMPKRYKNKSTVTIESRAEHTRSVNLFSHLATRWKERDDKPRRFIIFGKRMNESRAEKDARVLAKVPNARRMSWLENKVAHLFVPFINKARWVTVVISAALIIAFSAISSKGDFETGQVQLTKTDMLQRYEQAATYFLDTAPACDYCSNYYQRVDQFRSTRPEEFVKCDRGVRANLYVDLCGECLGSNKCVSCLQQIEPNVTTATKRFDNCGECRATTGGSCACTSFSACGVCEFLGRVPAIPGRYTGGANCDSTCDSANCAYCDPYSGTCYSATCSNNGALLSNNVCVCTNGRAGTWCQAEAACGFRGRIDQSLTGSATFCLCLGNFMGPRCQFCSCKNGGRCNAETGACECPAGYAGSLCETCLSTCGTCSGDWNITHYSTRSCVPNFCPGSTVNGTVCDECLYVSSAATGDSEEACWDKAGYYWHPKNKGCYPERTANGPTACASCKGYWTGPKCQSCSGPAGSTCLPNGDLLACDGHTYTKSNSGLVPRVDNCGFCTLNRATSCARPPPCAGGSCGVDWVTAYATITPWAGKKPQGTELLQQLRKFCSALAEVTIIRGGCLALLYPKNTVNFTELSSFVLASSNPEDMGFDRAGNFVYMRVRASVSFPLGASSSKIASEYLALQQDVSSNVDPSMRVILTGDPWVLAQSNLAVSTAMKFIVFLGLSVTIAAIFAMTLSIRLTLLVVCTVGGTVACTVGVIVLAGWEFNALVLCCFPGIFAVPICHISHMALHYMDRLEENQLQLFAREASTKEAVRTTMSRTLMTVIGACVASAIVCIPTAFSKVYAMYVVAMIMLVSHLWSLLFACVLFPGCLCALGPVTAARHVILAIAAIVVSFIIIAAIIAASNIGVGSGRVF